MSFAVGEGILPSIPLLEALEVERSSSKNGCSLVGTAAISGSRYEPFEVPSGTRIDLEPTEIRTPDLRIGIAGAADLAGSVDLRATLRFPREGFDVEEIPTEVLDLLTDAEGFVNLHAGLVGPLEAPRATLDRSGWQATAREAVERQLRRGLEEEAGKLLRGLLGGDDEEDGGRRGTRVRIGRKREASAVAVEGEGRSHVAHLEAARRWAMRELPWPTSLDRGSRKPAGGGASCRATSILPALVVLPRIESLENGSA